MIDLTGHKVLRESQNHRLYDHPHFEGALLKVRIDRPKKRLIARPSQLRYGNLRQWHREANEYLSALNRGCPEINRLAGFFGFTQTTAGPALISEKFSGPDGQLAQNLGEEIAALALDDPRRDTIKQEIIELVDDLERGKIIVGDLSPDNIVRAKERGDKLVVVDGVGERLLIPLNIISRHAFKASLNRRRKLMLGATHPAPPKPG
ncbi:hypothetical protein J7426_17875 [Tropicibacter sp. R16_0]|uniref:YrbL family protein n=1 Tax=Tropicibacter sp. R16_0 TaxID=2821102 RepID=UPI001ADA2FAA|nr:YrbL family protein [Tropicibacter sp. R16_0]MBO9452148.1 hypothetical protein [Tropicibacter sp. R16_0]